MFSCMAGAAVFLAVWALILVWHALVGGTPGALANGLAYAGLAIVAAAFISRCAIGWHPALKRASVLLTCAALAGVDVGLSDMHGEAGQKLFFAALLGIALVVLAARHAPASLRSKWLGGRPGDS
jgi:peptidoglycan/LPS O-acetylase OafA/YrhL